MHCGTPKFVSGTAVVRDGRSKKGVGGRVGVLFQFEL